MPVQYEGVNAEHETVRKGVGVFDVSHMGEFLIEGPNALDTYSIVYLQMMLLNSPLEKHNTVVCQMIKGELSMI